MPTDDKGGIDYSTIDGYVYVPHIQDVGSYDQKLPLIIYLHGGTKNSRGELDSDVLTKYMKGEYGTPKVKAYVAMPSSYSSKIDGVVEKIKAKYNIDENRISITGYSTGAYNAALAFENSKTKFSACICVSYRTDSVWSWQDKVDCPIVFIYEYYLSNSEKVRRAKKLIEQFVEKDTANRKVYTVNTIDGKYTDHGTIQKVYIANEIDILSWLANQSRK